MNIFQSYIGHSVSEMRNDDKNDFENLVSISSTLPLSNCKRAVRFTMRKLGGKLE